MLFNHSSNRLGKRVLCVLFLAFACRATAQDSSSEGEKATTAAPASSEFGFVNEIIDTYGLPDIAQIALDKMNADGSGDKVELDFLQARIRIRQGKSEEAEKIVAGLKADNPKGQALKLELAIFYHSTGESEKSKKYFAEFFAIYKDKKPTDPVVLTAYINASYVLAEIRKTEGKWWEAVKYYKQLIEGSKDKKIKRIFMVEIANGYVQMAKATDDAKKKAEHLKSADKYARDAMWQYDETFVSAIVALVNIELAKGEREKALGLMKEYHNDIITIENQLRQQDLMRLSARCHLRLVKGDVLAEDMKTAHAAGDNAKAKKLLQLAAVEYMNAFLKYEGNDHSDQAGLRFKDLETWGVENGYPKLRAPAGTDGMIAGRLLALAKKLRAQRKFAEAIPKYLEVLNTYPETRASGEALGGLAMCYAETGDDLSALATVSYSAERFSGNRNASITAGEEAAGQGVRNIASYYYKKKDNFTAIRACKLLGFNFLKDPYSPTLLWSSGELERGEGNMAESTRCYEFLVEHYAGDANAVKAANRLGFNAYEANDFETAVKWFEKGIELSPPGPKKAEGMFRLANSYVKVGQLPKAIKQFSILKKELNPEGPNKLLYYGNETDKAASADLLEQTIFFFAQSLTQLPDDAKGAAQLRALAVKEFESFVVDYPKSKLAPKALQRLGLLKLQLEEVDLAIGYFEQIPKKYPNYPGAKDIIYLIVDSAGGLGKTEIVREYTEKMTSNLDAYSAIQLIKVGMRLIDFEMYDLAEKVLGKVSEHPDAKGDPNIEQRALMGLAEALFKRGNHEEALKVASDFITKYPKSARKLEAMFIQAACHRELKNCDESMKVLGDITAQARDLSILFPERAKEFASKEFKKESELAITNYSCGNTGAAINSVVLLLKTRKAQGAEQEAIFKELCLKGIDWCIELEKWKVGSDLCEIFMSKWPLDNENTAIVRQRRSTIQSNE